RSDSVPGGATQAAGMLQAANPTPGFGGALAVALPNQNDARRARRRNLASGAQFVGWVERVLLRAKPIDHTASREIDGFRFAQPILHAAPLTINLRSPPRKRGSRAAGCGWSSPSQKRERTERVFRNRVAHR